MTTTVNPVLTTGPHELSIRGPMPLVMQLYPEFRRDGREHPEYYAIQLWYAVEQDVRDQNAEAQLILDHTMGLFGTFLVLRPDTEPADAEQIRSMLETKSMKRCWDEISVPGRHAILLPGRRAVSRKNSFFDALVDVLCHSEPTARDQDKQKLAATLVAMFFSGHKSKVRELAVSLSHQAKFGGPPSYPAD